jgi:hypothetical protein
LPSHPERPQSYIFDPGDIGDRHHSVIHDFFRDYHVDKKGGKKGSKSLPPGIAKNLARGKPLPPGIAKRALPGELLVKLPPVADGYERIIVAGKILLVEIATQVVHDILVDVILD